MNAPEFLTHTLPYIDTLYDYGAFLSRTGGHLGTLPAQCARDARIAIGGASCDALIQESLTSLHERDPHKRDRRHRSTKRNRPVSRLVRVPVVIVVMTAHEP